MTLKVLMRWHFGQLDTLQVHLGEGKGGFNHDAIKDRNEGWRTCLRYFRITPACCCRTCLAHEPNIMNPQQWVPSPSLHVAHVTSHEAHALALECWSDWEGCGAGFGFPRADDCIIPATVFTTCKMTTAAIRAPHTKLQVIHADIWMHTPVAVGTNRGSVGTLGALVTHTETACMHACGFLARAGLGCDTVLRLAATNLTRAVPAREMHSHVGHDSLPCQVCLSPVVPGCLTV